MQNANSKLGALEVFKVVWKLSKLQRKNNLTADSFNNFF